MLISCLTVTQPSRYAHLQQAIDCFQRQTWPDKQLVLVVDGDDDYRQRLEALCEEKNVNAKVVLGQGSTLGEKRNESVAAADGELLCYWDDDDQCHPARLTIQANGLQKSGADFCYLSGNWAYFADTGELTWSDWQRDGNGEFHPNLPNWRCLGGSMMARADRMLPYPSKNECEDSLFLSFAVLRKAAIHVLEGYGWCYVYIFHGDHKWQRSHYEQMNYVRCCPLNAAEIEQAVQKMQQEFDPDFSIQAVLDEYNFNHAGVQLQARERVAT